MLYGNDVMTTVTMEIIAIMIDAYLIAIAMLLW